MNFNETIIKWISDDVDITIRACDGTRTIAQAKGLSKGYIDSDFNNLDGPAEPSRSTKVKVGEMQRNATFKEMFLEINSDLDKLCLNQDQICAFVEDYSNWLHPVGFATFFLLKMDVNYFVVSVSSYQLDSPDKLTAYIHKFEYNILWRANLRHRVVVPKEQTQPLIPLVA